MSRPFRFAVLSGISLIADNVADLLTSGRRILRKQEKLMADFANLRTALEEQRTELVSAIDRVADDVQALQDKISELKLDTADQQQVDELAAQVRQSVDTLRGIDPVQVVDEGSGGGAGSGEGGGEGGGEPAPAEPGTGEGEGPAGGVPAAPTPDTDEFGNPVR